MNVTVLYPMLFMVGLKMILSHAMNIRLFLLNIEFYNAATLQLKDVSP